MINNYSSNIRLLFFVILFSINGINCLAQVGVETEDPKTDLDINGALSLREGSALVLTEGEYNIDISLDVSPYSLYSVTGPTDIFAISGIVPLSGADGQIVVIQNTTNATMIIAHEHNLSTAENRILVPGERDLYIRGKDASITLQYNAFQNRWVLLNNLNHVETWYTDGFVRLGKNTATTITITDPDIKSTSSISVNLVNNHGLSDARKFNLIVEYIETQDGKFIFRVNNKNTSPKWTYVQYAFTINY